MYTLITAKSLWTIICIGEITVLYVQYCLSGYWSMEKIYSMYNMEGYMTRYLANLRLGTPTHIYRVAKKTALLRFFEQFFAKQNFFKMTL
jgi:hypothetical protein